MIEEWTGGREGGGEGRKGLGSFCSNRNMSRRSIQEVSYKEISNKEKQRLRHQVCQNDVDNDEQRGLRTDPQQH